MQARSMLFVFSSLVLLEGCGKEVWRVPFSGAGTGVATVTLKPGDVDFWTDISIEYDSDTSLAYQIDVQQGGASVGTATCNPLGPINVKSTWIETNLGSKHTRSGNGKMACSVKVDKGGSTTVKVSLAFAKKPASGGIKKADLVIKQ